MFAGKKSAQIREILINESAWEEMTCLFAPSLTGVRTQELRFARWEDIDFETKLWEIPAEVMKMKRPHIVPLSEQVIMLFKQLEPISKHHPLVFIGRNDPRKPISKESINQVIELLGYKGRLTGHGFRHTMSTILHEQGFNSAWIEMQLGKVRISRSFLPKLTR